MSLDVVTSMKVSVLKDFDNFLYNISYGYKNAPDLILHKISFIQASYDFGDNLMPIYDKLITSKVSSING